MSVCFNNKTITNDLDVLFCSAKQKGQYLFQKDYFMYGSYQQHRFSQSINKLNIEEMVSANDVGSMSTESIQSKDAITQTISSLIGLLGFTILHIGLCQPKNSSSIIINNLFSSCIAVLTSWAVGFAFCFGSASNSFTSYSMYFLINADTKVLETWLFYCSLTVLFTVICNGGFLERLKLTVNASTTLILTGLIFPVGCHWCWHQNGWLYHNLKNPKDSKELLVYDSIGLGPIHISAGSVALFGGLFLKARPERKALLRFHLVSGKTNVNVFFGGFLAVFSLLNLKEPLANRQKFCANGIISCLTSSLVAIMFKRSRVAGEISSVRTLINGALTGLVATSSETSNGFHPYASFGIGMSSGIVYIACSSFLKHFRFDDVVDSVSVHLGGGIWGQLATSLIDKSRGVFYAGTNDSLKWLGWSLLGIIAYVSWTGIATVMIMLPFHLCGRLKYTENVYDEGIDTNIFKEPAYPDIKVLSIDCLNKEIPVDQMEKPIQERRLRK